MDLMRIKILSVSIFCIFLTACMGSPTEDKAEASDSSSTPTQEAPAKTDGEEGAASAGETEQTGSDEQTEENKNAESDQAVTKDETTEAEEKAPDAANTEENSSNKAGDEKSDEAATESPKGNESSGDLQVIDVEDPAVIAAATFAAEQIGNGELDTVLDAKVI